MCVHLLPSTASRERGEARSSCTFRAVRSNARWPRRIVAIPRAFRSPRRRPSQFNPYPRSPPDSCPGGTSPEDSGGRSVPAAPGARPHRSPGYAGGTEGSRGTLAGHPPEAPHRRVIPNIRVSARRNREGRTDCQSGAFRRRAATPGWAGRRAAVAIITISRGTFSGGSELAQRVADRLGCQCTSREVILEAAWGSGISAEEITTAMEKRPSF